MNKQVKCYHSGCDGIANPAREEAIAFTGDGVKDGWRTAGVARHGAPRWPPRFANRRSGAAVPADRAGWRAATGTDPSVPGAAAGPLGRALPAATATSGLRARLR
jgi:hypothetical protein